MADYVNIAFPLRPGSDGAFAQNDNTIDAIKDDLKILLLSNHGERPIHGDYGANLRSVLFDLGGPDGLRKIEDLIFEAVSKWMPFLIIDRLIIKDSTTDPGLVPNQVHVRIEFSVGQLTGVLEQQIRN
jgi:phage baseplate assembly protein W